ncbi:hypothetical protein L596_030523 [Steinernema carpocapsae]|uniref:Uncharacterized protein n=1 Tax=Steinernema carpocapsae TaxID=34508 RepID=A0A4U5LPP1_STECR|nr:hypothetical protein L596_030523 [Steinernema carpocapsae]
MLVPALGLSGSSLYRSPLNAQTSDDNLDPSGDRHRLPVLCHLACIREHDIVALFQTPRQFRGILFRKSAMLSKNFRQDCWSSVRSGVSHSSFFFTVFE